MKKFSLATSNQKLSLLVVMVIGITTLVFGVISLRKTIFLPFVRRSTGVVFKSTEQLEKDRIEALKNKDTDGDQLTDYDELYIYRTSPFLEDTDSDGLLDSVEIASNTDPNCPKEKVCRQTRTSSQGTSTGSTATGEIPATGEIGGTPTGLTGEIPATGEIGGTPTDTTGQVPATDEINPITKAIIDTFGTDIESLTPKAIEEKMKAMTTDQLKEFYIKLGMPADSVNQADDTTLRQLFLETLRDMGLMNGTLPTSPGASGTPPAATP
jgi:hypothetical protein